MAMTNEKKYISILESELVPATGCTEPIALAYVSAYARKELGALPDSIDVEVSGNIIKNVKSVVVPNTNGLKGIEAAVAVGTVAGNADLMLDVLSQVTPEQKEEVHKYLQEHEIHYHKLDTEHLLDMIVTVHKNQEYVKVRLTDLHTNIVDVEKNGKTIYHKDCDVVACVKELKSEMCIDEIWEFANTVPLEKVQAVIQRQIDCNEAIACYGIDHDYGANVGRTILQGANTIEDQIKAYTAAGSDARMSGCEMPVVVNSGSGNQGMTVSVPLIVYAKEKNLDQELLMRGLVLSNLLAIHQKAGIGRLSAFCGVVSASIGAVCGIAYLNHETRECIDHIIVNALAIDSGIVCDGAKPSCAGKIAVSLETAFLGYKMYRNGQQFKGGDGIVTKGVENTLKNVSRLAKNGMKETDEEILNIMTNC